MTGIVFDGPLTARDVELAAAAGIGKRWPGEAEAKAKGRAAVAGLADLIGTNPEGVATALRLFRSNLCGAAEVLEHVEAERDALRARLAELGVTP